MDFIAFRLTVHGLVVVEGQGGGPVALLKLAVVYSDSPNEPGAD